MKQYLCTRYPVDKKHGGVSRAWLVEQLHVAKYPNLLLEVALNPAPPALIAIKSGVSEDVLVDIILGKDDITWDETQALREALLTDVGYPCYDFAFSKELDPYEETEDGNGLKEARRDARKLKYKHPAVPIIKKLLRQETPPAVVIRMLNAFDDYQKPEYSRRAQVTPRALPFKAWEANGETDKELDEQMIDELEGEALDDLFNSLKPTTQREVLVSGLKTVVA